MSQQLALHEYLSELLHATASRLTASTTDSIPLTGYGGLISTGLTSLSSVGTKSSIDNKLYKPNANHHHAEAVVLSCLATRNKIDNLSSSTYQITVSKPFNLIPGEISLQASVVLPTFNERENIGKLITTIEEIFENHSIDGEIIVVDDNSPDGTAIIAQKLAEEYGNIKVILRPHPMGVGSAIRDGIKQSTKDTILLMDCDFSHPPSLIPKLIMWTKHADIVVASRYVSSGGMVAPRIRVLASRIVNLFVRLVVNIPVNDATGGYHAIKKHIFDNIDFITPDGDYDIELLGKARKKGFKMLEYPYVYQFRESGISKTFSIKYVLRYFITALKVRIGFL